MLPCFNIGCEHAGNVFCCYENVSFFFIFSALENMCSRLPKRCHRKYMITSLIGCFGNTHDPAEVYGGSNLSPWVFFPLCYVRYKFSCPPSLCSVISCYIHCMRDCFIVSDWQAVVFTDLCRHTLFLLSEKVDRHALHPWILFDNNFVRGFLFVECTSQLSYRSYSKNFKSWYG